MIRAVTKLFFFVPLCLVFNGIAQVPKFNMSDTTVSVCKGQLFDSGGPTNIYSNQEDIKFTICTGNVITMVFSGPFCTESGKDGISFFDGPDITSPKIGLTYSGTTSPGKIVANSGCLTVHFKSDLSVAYCGWNATWYSQVIPPVPPDFAITTPSCNDTALFLTLTSGYRCDFVLPGSFKITGPVNPIVKTATAIGCNANATNSIRLGLSKPLNQNCSYTIVFDLSIYDNCDSLWKFIKTTSTLITNCPYTASVRITGNDSICNGSCTKLTAVPSAACLSYNYSWSHGLPSSPGPHSVCPLVNTTYTVTIQESNGGSPVTATQIITVNSPKIVPLLSDTFCQSVLPFNLMASPPKGIWTGPGIIDSIKGTFHPDTAGPGTFYVKYKINRMCSDSVKIVIKEMDAGYDDAACTGSSTFQVSGGFPAGGVWSGTPYISSTGIFTPTIAGVYTVTYTYPNGCNESKNIFVNTLNVPSNVDTLCQSVWYDSLNTRVSPPGGRFYGNGVVDSTAGIFVPSKASPGLQTITYKLSNGCSAIFSIYVKQIYVPSSATSCPTQGQIMLPSGIPAGGVWAGPGIINSNGLYDPAATGVSNHNDTLIYTAPNACTDTLIMRSYKTNIFPTSLNFCLNDDSLKLIYANLNFYPTAGIWIGKGISLINGNYYFKPTLAGVGTHKLFYTKNTCSDSIIMKVYPNKLAADSMLICSSHAGFLIDSLVPSAASWKGAGITNSSTGFFDPAVSGVGTFKVVYTSPKGCSDYIIITVYQYQQAKIYGLSNTYCFKDTTFILNTVPSSGILTGKGIAGKTFNLKNAGEGQFYIKFTFGTGYCLTTDSLLVSVYPKLQTLVSVSEDSICNVGGSAVTITPSGGNPQPSYFYSWSNGGFPVNSAILYPTTSTTYFVTTSDGCSDPVVDTIPIVVNPSFTVGLNTSAIDCYGVPGYATAVISPTDNYSYKWNSSPIETSATLNGIAGKSYLLHIRSQTTGCALDTLVKIPSYDFIRALFSPNPNLTCVPLEDNLITFIDLSNGADTGYWNFNGVIVPYSPGQIPQFKFDEPGSYTVKLTVLNQGNCTDTYSMQICLRESGEIFIPDIFSPDGDGVNDILFVRGKGIQELQFVIYDRWGEKIFETNDPLKGWDGTYHGQPASPAVYVYYVKAMMNFDKKVIQKGNVSLIR